MKILEKLLAAAIFFVMASPASAVLVGTNGSLSSKNVAAEIIAAPADATDDAAHNEAIQAFNEIIGYILLLDLDVDGAVDIAAGTRVDSHMIFLNSGPGDNGELIEHGAGGSLNTATFTFDGMILGVMSDQPGTLESASSGFLGAPGTIYPGSFNARGLEGNDFPGKTNDWYNILVPNTIELGMRVTEPGDWIRVVTLSAIPIPAALPLFGTGLGILGFLGWRRRRQAATA